MQRSALAGSSVLLFLKIGSATIQERAVVSCILSAVLEMNPVTHAVAT